MNEFDKINFSLKQKSIHKIKISSLQISIKL